MAINHCEYYSTHGFFSDPVDYSGIFDQFSSNVSDICDMTFNIMISDFPVNMRIYQLTEDSKDDVNPRDVGNILGVIVKRNQESGNNIRLIKK